MRILLILPFLLAAPALAQFAPNGIQRTSDDVGPREDGSGAFRTHCVEVHESYDALWFSLGQQVQRIITCFSATPRLTQTPPFKTCNAPRAPHATAVH